MHFQDDPIRIEGHTKGGNTRFWQTLADDRARIVADLMVEHGANPKMITTVGLPGTTGLNETRTIVYFDIPEITGRTELRRLSPVDTHPRPMRQPQSPLSQRGGSGRWRPGSVERRLIQN